MLNVTVKFLDMFKDSFKNNHFKHYEHSMYLICETLINQLNMMFKHVMSYEAMFFMVWKSAKLNQRGQFRKENLKLAKILCLYRYRGILCRYT